MKIIDASGLIAGRLASYVAKQALLGEKIVILNCEKAVVSGTRKTLAEEYAKKGGIGRPFHGPFRSTMPDRFVRRIIRGMLPFHQTRGREAFKRVMCYISVPKEFEDKEHTTIENAAMERLRAAKYLTIERLTQLVG